MRRSALLAAVALMLLAAGALAVVLPPAAAAATACGSVSYTIPGTDGQGRAALNNLTASGVSCSTARAVAKAFLAGHKTPKGWHAASKTVVSHGNTIGEEIFTRGSARIVGDIAN